MAKKTTRRWSAEVTTTSDAMDVASGTFKQRSAKKIAEDVERDAERSNRTKRSNYASAMSALTFYENRAGHNLSAADVKTLERAKEILRAEFGPDAPESEKKRRGQRKGAPAPKAGATRTTSTRKKTSARKKTAAKR